MPSSVIPFDINGFLNASMSPFRPFDRPLRTCKYNKIDATYMSPNRIEQIATAISSLIVNPELGVLSVVRMSAENNTSFTPVIEITFLVEYILIIYFAFRYNYSEFPLF